MRLRSGLPAVTPDRAAAYAAAAARPYHSFKGLPEEAWPLFLSAKQYLHMLDGRAAAVWLPHSLLMARTEVPAPLLPLQAHCASPSSSAVPTAASSTHLVRLWCGVVWF